MSTRLVGTPVQLAIARFCVTARTNSPSRVRASSNHIRMRTAAAKPMMTIRLHGSTIPVIATNPPDIHDGFSTWTF